MLTYVAAAALGLLALPAAGLVIFGMGLAYLVASRVTEALRKALRLDKPYKGDRYGGCLLAIVVTLPIVPGTVAAVPYGLARWLWDDERLGVVAATSGVAWFLAYLLYKVTESWRA